MGREGNMVELEEVRLQLVELGLSQLALQLDALLESAQKEKETYLSFLRNGLEAEISLRRERNIEVKFHMARLPYRKTLTEFDFSFQPSIEERVIRELAGLAFLERKENLLFLGPPGVGKSHLAVALGVEVLLQGFAVYFTSLSRLLEDLKSAYEENRLDKRLSIYLRPKLLIIDEVGYLPLDHLGATLFFQLVSGRYERGSIIITSNKGFGEWGEVMGDLILATALLDRLLHHAQVVNIRGNSYRLKDRIRAGIYGTPHSDSPS